ncbi:pentapeptide repeat-containing protein [Microbacterium sp. ARD32]|uniref:pentapeptide repeat-containing protein n=1 Tax=Microbacterium sp. ARD32 TaxID=2962577 RepID=UPI002881292B|nr:pentapeptide repeat-containing protein [Microbacterium sp. ARD32]MDT0157452.1 pentapeptide repeat-containing protein [Microbacterium sp. ARD32]
MPRSPSSLQAPRVSAPDLPDHLDAARPQRSAELLSARIELSGDVDLAHSTLEQCVLAGSAESLELTGATLMDIDMSGLRIVELRARDATLRRVRLCGGRIGTLDLSDTRIHELELSGVRIDYLTLGGTKAVDVRIDDCQITALDLPAATLTRVAFSETRADEVDPRELRAEHVDLRGLDALSFLDVTSLRGTTLSVLQVQQLSPVLAASAGIFVRD